MKTSPNKKIPKHIIEAFKELPTSTLSDVLDSLGLGGVITGIFPIIEQQKLVGLTVPVKAVCGSRGTYPLDDFAVGSVIEAASPGDVIFFDLGGTPVSTWGGLASQAAINKGLAGVVANGGVRDIDEIRQLKFPVFAKHRVPTTGKSRVRILSINKPIECCEVFIKSNDIIVGDSTGLVVIPSQKASDILQKAKEFEELERRFENELNQGHSFKEAAQKLHHL